MTEVDWFCIENKRNEKKIMETTIVILLSTFIMFVAFYSMRLGRFVSLIIFTLVKSFNLIQAYVNLVVRMQQPVNQMLKLVKSSKKSIL